MEMTKQDKRWYEKQADADRQLQQAVDEAKKGREAAHTLAERDYYAALKQADNDCADATGSKHRLKHWEPTAMFLFGTGQYEFEGVCVCGFHARGFGPDQATVEIARHRSAMDEMEQTEFGRWYQKTLQEYAVAKEDA